MMQRPTLPHSFPCSTIGEERLNFGVRDGIRCISLSIITSNFANLIFSLSAEAVQIEESHCCCSDQIFSYFSIEKPLPLDNSSTFKFLTTK